MKATKLKEEVIFIVQETAYLIAGGLYKRISLSPKLRKVQKNAPIVKPMEA